MSLLFFGKTRRIGVVCAVIASLAGCSNGGSQVAPVAPTQPGTSQAAPHAVQPNSIVYTPVSEQIPANGRLKVDLNNDGVSDFTFVQTYSVFYGQHGIGPPQPCGAIGALFLEPKNLGRNGVANGAQEGWAAKLSPGTPIDSTVSFDHASSLLYGFAEGCLPPHHLPYSHGYWQQATGLLGLEFKMLGQVHYGWARLVEGTLTGYAYETVAGQSIAAGQTQ